MPSDNVTPFRRPKPVRPQQQGGMGFKTHRGKVLLVHVLTLLCFGLPWLISFPASDLVTLAFGIAAALIAVSSRASATPWAATHHLQAVHTLLIAMAIYMLINLPAYILTTDSLAPIMATVVRISFWALLIVSIWALLRAAIGLVLALMRRAVPNPRGLLI